MQDYLLKASTSVLFMEDTILLCSSKATLANNFRIYFYRRQYNKHEPLKRGAS